MRRACFGFQPRARRGGGIFKEGQRVLGDLLQVLFANLSLFFLVAILRLRTCRHDPSKTITNPACTTERVPALWCSVAE
jgi:hypothetical protein